MHLGREAIRGVNEWVVAVDGELVAELQRDIELGPILSDGRRLFEEQVVGSLGGLRIEILSREHPPPHFRVSYQGQSNNSDICTGSPLPGQALERWFGNIRKWHAKNRGKLIEAWNSSRPSDCPVGEAVCPD